MASCNMHKGPGRSTCQSEPWDRCLNPIPQIYQSIDLNRSSNGVGRSDLWSQRMMDSERSTLRIDLDHLLEGGYNEMIVVDLSWDPQGRV